MVVRTQSDPEDGGPRTRGLARVQSIERAMDLLETMADAGGELGLSELAQQSGLPLPTIHRLLRTMVHRGYARQLPSRRYALGPRLMFLGDVASQMMRVWVRPHLSRLVEHTGETANMALLEGDEVVYVAQVPSRNSMRMFTEVGRRVQPHCTGVGKALLSTLPDADVLKLLARTGMPAKTPRTIVEPAEMLAHLAQVRRRGYAVDDGEQEHGVRCVAVPLLGLPTRAALSVSGPASRLTEDQTGRIAAVLQVAVADLHRSMADATTDDRKLPPARPAIARSGGTIHDAE